MILWNVMNESIKAKSIAKSKVPKFYNNPQWVIGEMKLVQESDFTENVVFVTSKKSKSVYIEIEGSWFKIPSYFRIENFYGKPELAIFAYNYKIVK